MSLRLLSPGMPDDDELYRKRLGFWLRAARERSGKSQAGAAEQLGFSTKSKSTISDYETGRTEPSLRTLRVLAAWYGVPLEVFTRPAETPEELIDRVVSGASALEREDWASGEDRGRAAGDEPDVGPRRQTA